MEHEALFNFGEVLARVNRDRELFRTVAGLFLAQGPDDAAQRAPAVQGEELSPCPEYRLVMKSDPIRIPEALTWLIQTTALTLPESERLRLRGALHELLFNAVEHGNLELSYHDKRRALAEGRYEEWLVQRARDPRFTNRQVTVHVRGENGARGLTYDITDEGKGFAWSHFLKDSHEVCESRASNGRGIALVRSLFPNLTYNEQGNEATITALFV